MPGLPRKHDIEKLRDIVPVALAAARQLGQDVFIQADVRRGLVYRVCLEQKKFNKASRNCYRVTPKGEIIPFPQNAPYVEPHSEHERRKQKKAADELSQRELALRERAFREAEKHMGTLAREFAGTDADGEDFLVKQDYSDDQIVHGATVIEGAEGT
jgi:hypothetical protein